MAETNVKLIDAIKRFDTALTEKQNERGYSAEKKFSAFMSGDTFDLLFPIQSANFDEIFTRVFKSESFDGAQEFLSIPGIPTRYGTVFITVNDGMGDLIVAL